MAKDKPIPRLVDLNRRWEEQEFRNCGMKIGDFKPCLVVKVDAWHACRIKAAAARRSGHPKRKLHYEGNYLSEFALDRHLWNIDKRHKWAGLGSKEPPDFKLWQGRKMYTVDAHSARHRTMVRYSNNPGITYPVRRLGEPERQLDDYLFGASVCSFTDGSSWVMFWGAIERERLATIMRKLWGEKPIPKGQQYVRIPLKEFDCQLMKNLLKWADAGRRIR